MSRNTWLLRVYPDQSTSLGRAKRLRKTAGLAVTSGYDPFPMPSVSDPAAPLVGAGGGNVLKCACETASGSWGRAGAVDG